MLLFEIKGLAYYVEEKGPACWAEETAIMVVPFFWLRGLFLVIYSISSLIYLWRISYYKRLHEKVCKSITFLRAVSKSYLLLLITPQTIENARLFMTWPADSNYIT